MTYESIIDLVKESAGETFEPIRMNKFVARDIAIVAERMNGGSLSFAHITVMLNAGAIIFVDGNKDWKFAVYKNGDGFYYNDISLKRRKNRKASFIKTELELRDLLTQDGFYEEKEPEQKPIRIEVSAVESVKAFDELIEVRQGRGATHPIIQYADKHGDIQQVSFLCKTDKDGNQVPIVMGERPISAEIRIIENGRSV